MQFLMLTIHHASLSLTVIVSVLSSVVAICHEDNVYRGVMHRGDVSFCSTYLATSYSRIIPNEPTYLTTYPPSRVSSACSCVLARMTSPNSASITASVSFTSPTSTATTDGSTTAVSTSSPVLTSLTTSLESYPKPTLSSMDVPIFSLSSTVPSFTGVHVAMRYNVSKCYMLPTPIDNPYLDHMPIPTNRLNESSPITYFHYSRWTWKIPYLTVRNSENDSFIIEAFNSTALGIIGPRGSWFFIDGDGMSLGTKDCTFVLDIRIDNFGDQIADQVKILPNTTDSRVPSLFRRGQAPCENSIKDFVDGIPGGIPGLKPVLPPIPSPNWSNAFRVIVPFIRELLKQGVIRQAFLATGWLWPELIAVLFIIMNIVAGIKAVIFVAFWVCCKFHGAC